MLMLALSRTLVYFVVVHLLKKVALTLITGHIQARNLSFATFATMNSLKQKDSTRIADAILGKDHLNVIFAQGPFQVRLICEITHQLTVVWKNMFVVNVGKRLITTCLEKSFDYARNRSRKTVQVPLMWQAFCIEIST